MFTFLIHLLFLDSKHLRCDIKMNVIALHYQLIMTLTYTFRHCTLISSQHSMGMTDLQTFKLVPMNCLAILPCICDVNFAKKFTPGGALLSTYVLNR